MITPLDTTPFDLSGAVAESQIRASPGDEFVAGAFAPDIPGDPPGVILLHLTHAVSTALPERP